MAGAAKSPLVLWHLLSLDAPTVAALWTWFIAEACHVHIPLLSTLAMAVAVWTLYAADRLLDEAIIPFAEIRQRVPGYAVSLVKAGARLRHQAVGSVRTPLADPVIGDIEDLRQLLKGLGLDHPLSDLPAWDGTSGAGQ